VTPERIAARMRDGPRIQSSRELNGESLGGRGFSPGVCVGVTRALATEAKMPGRIHLMRAK
jgi:hypothetical protein